MWMTRVSINNPVFATMVMVALCVLGLFAYQRLGVEEMPEVQLPGAWMDVRYPGASPEIVESEVSKKVEEAVNAIAGVNALTSRSYEGQSSCATACRWPRPASRGTSSSRSSTASRRATSRSSWAR